MLMMLLGMLPPIVGPLAIEHYVLRSQVPWLYEAKSGIASRAFSTVILVNVVGTSVLMLNLGFRVGSARKMYKELAEKKDDEHAEARYSLPKLYAEGFSEEAKKFNCVQRGHQQALESYPQFLALSLIGGLTSPLTSAFGGILWTYARVMWANDYASGDPSKRYNHWSARWIWNGLLLQMITSIGTAVYLITAE